ncbi:MAG TPA: heme biosynthesis HemY N-terminal domain-containing protein [Pelagibacterium sp.]|uniref:heme biosynthesis protein HemY n=1 Tax=Pelagibacterium sp. TaxID=1967288 RepID=UPI002CC07571|nr:heme biosynthesis HemY N-terminal domain-containing protein [Pelagibacterium sp.]HWJ87337.1 heme biosynthesis HemY N-terminal domain-containing protein [Pelagibacterium sp.]
MMRLVLYLVASLVLALGAAWTMSLPGTVEIAFGSWRMSPGPGFAILTVLVIAVLAALLWGLFSRAIGAPAALARANARRREKAGVEALSDAVIALQAGEFSKARMLARDARAKLPDNPAAKLLEARTELALGDLASAREHYRALISNERTALAALSGLYDQARTQNRNTAAITFARKALAISPSLDWASEAVFDDLAARGDWAEALNMSASLPARTRVQKAAKSRRQGVLETALALTLEETEPDAAYEHAQKALRAIADFVPAALVAARILINRGDTRRASALLRRVWKASSHPDAATLYAHVTPGSSAVERLRRIEELVAAPGNNEAAAIVLARAAIDAYEWELARKALAPFVVGQPTRDMCLLMAEIEEGQSGDQGASREWLARAVTAPANPVWTADGVTSDEWAPASPVTGRLDAFAWKVPLETRPVRLLADPERAAEIVRDPAPALPHPSG